ncbi:MAG: hypothetical protein VX519_01020 [Myxococcota bacterium]|nr:hypothetical protein [Myxococcota bacterium]
MQKMSVLLLSWFGMGCIATPTEAPTFAQISAPDDVELAWSYAYNELDDGIGALIILDFFVFDGNTGLPMDNIEVELLTNWGGAYLIPQTAVKIVPPPEELSPEECDANVDGQIDEDAPDACSWNWDTSGNQYFEMATEFADAYKPNYMLAGTDEHGVLRAWTYIDSLPVSHGDADGNYEFDGFVVWASIGHMNADVEIGTGN